MVDLLAGVQGGQPANNAGQGVVRTGGSVDLLSGFDPNAIPNNLERAIGEFVRDKPVLQDVLLTLGQPGSAVSNALRGRFGAAGRNVAQFFGKTADALLPGDVIPDITEEGDLSSFKDVLTDAGVGDLGEVDLPLIGRVTGKGALGLVGDIATDPLRFGRVGRLSQAGRQARGSLAQTALGNVRAAAEAAGDPVTRLGRQAAEGQRSLLGFRVPFSQRVVEVARGTPILERVGRGQEAAGKLFRPFSTTTPIPEFREGVEAGLAARAGVGTPLVERFAPIVPEVEKMAKAKGLDAAEVFSDMRRIAEQQVDVKDLVRSGRYTLDEARRVKRLVRDGQRAFKDEVGEGFSVQEVENATRIMIANPELQAHPLGPQIALGAQRANKVFGDILDADHSIGIGTAPLNDEGLNYIYRLVTPQARKFLEDRGLKDSVFTRLGQRLSAKGRPQKQRSLVGIDIEDANKWFKETNGVDFDLFEPDLRFSLAGRISRTENAAQLGGMLEHFGKSFGELTSEATDRAGYVPMANMLDELGFSDTGVRGLGSSLDAMRDLSVPPELAQELRRYAEVLRNPKTPGRLLQAFDSFSGAFKSLVTAPFPAFHARNAISNFYANFLGDVSPSAYVPATRVMAEWLRIAKGSEAGATLGSMGITALGFADMTVRTFVDQLKAHRAFGFGQFSLDELLGAKRRGVGQAVRTLPGTNFGRKVGDTVESYAKVAHVLDKLQKGFSFDEAIASAKKYLFDYGDLTPVERTYMRRVVPFYTFARKNLPLMLESLVTRPGKASMIGHMQRALQRPAGGDEPVNQSLVPDWMKSRLFGFARHDDSDSVNILSGFGIGLEDLSRLDKPLQEFLGIFRDMHPVPKAIVQAATDRDLFTGKELGRADAVNPAIGMFENIPGGQAFLDWLGFRRVKDRKGREIYARADPRKLNWLSMLSSPASRVSSTIQRLNREGFNEQTGLQFGLGIRRRSFGPEERARQNLRSVLDLRRQELASLLEETGEVGELSNKFFIRSQVGEPDSPQKQRAREILKEIRELERARKRLSQ